MGKQYVPGSLLYRRQFRSAHRTQMVPESSEDIVSQSPVLILFQQLRLATVLKAQGVSNDAPTGGGARDLRLRPYDRFQPFMERLLPETCTQPRQDGGEVTIRYGLATWGDGSEMREIKYWPPTNARPGEGRIAHDQFTATARRSAGGCGGICHPVCPG